MEGLGKIFNVSQPSQYGCSDCDRFKFYKINLGQVATHAWRGYSQQECKKGEEKDEGKNVMSKGKCSIK